MSISRLHRIKIGPRNKYRNLTGPTMQCRTSQISMHCRASKRSLLRPFFKQFLLINFSGVHIYCRLDIHTPAQIDFRVFCFSKGGNQELFIGASGDAAKKRGLDNWLKLTNAMFSQSAKQDPHEWGRVTPTLKSDHCYLCQSL